VQTFQNVGQGLSRIKMTVPPNISRPQIHTVLTSSSSSIPETWLQKEIRSASAFPRKVNLNILLLVSSTNLDKIESTVPNFEHGNGRNPPISRTLCGCARGGIDANAA
jgi:hypothetical protein